MSDCITYDLTHATMIVLAINRFYVFMIFLILMFSVIFVAIQIRYNLHM